MFPVVSGGLGASGSDLFLVPGSGAEPLALVLPRVLHFLHCIAVSSTAGYSPRSTGCYGVVLMTVPPIM